MKILRSSCVLLLAILWASFVAQAQAKPGASLQDVLALMDRTSHELKTVQADFTSDQYQRVVDEHDKQSGTTYFKRTNKGMEMYATFAKPNEKQVLFANGTVEVYLPNANQITKYSAGKNKDVFESFLVLGFGGSGQDLQKTFDVKFAGTESISGVNTYRLDLTPKSQRARAMFQTIVLWIDAARGVSVQQKFIEPSSGDYRVATYSNIKINASLSDNVFALKTKPDPKIVTPQ
ncbi:MAG TPA: outer membrane lipoprotein-sorting protein [candidate division Zixibacteria bacterium]|nr:outer membrane lipoprotein-sorting protein [candidate division Zixibacteria bacterium]